MLAKMNGNKMATQSALTVTANTIHADPATTNAPPARRIKTCQPIIPKKKIINNTAKKFSINLLPSFQK